MADYKKTFEFVDKEWRKEGGVVDQLKKYIEIPNQSPMFDKEWETNGYTMKAVELIVEWIKAQNVEGLKVQVIKEDKRTPLIFAEIPASGTTVTESIFMYGHMDKQPPLTASWDQGLGPYTPVIKDDKLYGRGGADDGYASFACITALKALKASGLPHPRIVVFIEAAEESGSIDLPYYVEKLKADIGDLGLIICLDSGCGNYNQFWITDSLRGLVGATLKVTILKEGVHSGSFSGTIPSSFRILRHLLDRIENSSTGQIIPELGIQIPEDRISNAQATGKVLGPVLFSDLPLLPGASPVTSDPTELLLNRTWRPQLAVTGVDGFPTLGAAGNVLRPFSAFKLSLRLPPTKNPKEAAEKLKEILEKDPPYGVKVELDADKFASGWAAPKLTGWLEESVKRASEGVFGAVHTVWGEGGSIPFMGMLGEKYPKAQFVVTGVLGPGSNAHGPNEFLKVDMGVKVNACVVHVITDFVAAKQQ